MTHPTKDLYSLFDLIYDFYNANLFDGTLPNCMFVIVRKNGTFGYYIPKKWINKESEKTDEIAINPLMFGKFPLMEILQTIVHEMTHLWQENLGTPPRRGYHDKEWGNKMESIGLMPSSTGQIGGNKTGQQMMDYPIIDGLFEIKTKELINTDVFSKLWLDVSTPYIGGINDIFDTIMIENNNETFSIINSLSSAAHHSESPTEIKNIKPIKNLSDKSKVKYTCKNCNFNVWGKLGLIIICGSCNSNYE